MKNKILNFILDKKKLTNISYILVIYFTIYIIYLFITKKPINIFNFYILTFFSHIFFLVVIPLEGLFYIQIKNATLNPIIFLTLLTSFATLAYGANYQIGKEIPDIAFKNYLGKKKFNNYKKKYEKYGNILLFIAASTPFLPGPIFSLLNGFFKENLKKTLTISFIGLFTKWILFYIIFIHANKMIF